MRKLDLTPQQRQEILMLKERQKPRISMKYIENLVDFENVKHQFVLDSIEHMMFHKTTQNNRIYNKDIEMTKQEIEAVLTKTLTNVKKGETRTMPKKMSDEPMNIEEKFVFNLHNYLISTLFLVTNSDNLNEEGLWEYGSKPMNLTLSEKEKQWLNDNSIYSLFYLMEAAMKLVNNDKLKEILEDDINFLIYSIGGCFYINREMAESRLYSRYNEVTSQFL